MKRFIMSLAGAMLVLALAACSPTHVKKTQSETEPLAEASTGGASDKVPDPNVEPMEIISVYSPNNEDDGLNQAMDAVDELTAQALVDKLIEYNVLADDCKILKFEMTDGVATLDLSGVPEGSDDEKTLILAAIGNTFTENFELGTLKILVNGENLKDLEFNRDYKKIL